MTGSIYSWSTTASSNDSADGGINWTEGQNAKTVNNSARQMMGRVAELLLDLGGQGTVGGTANAITLTLESAFTTLVDGLICSLQPTADNTDAVTLNVNSIGAKSIRKFDSTGEVALASGDLQSGGFYHLIYDSSANSLAGAWIVLNPTAQAQNANLTAIAALTPTDSNIIVGNGTTWTAESGATARASLGLASSTTDNTVPRFDGTSGAMQTSGIAIDDSDNLSTAGYVWGRSGGTGGVAFKIGNDATINDADTANALAVVGVADTSKGFIKFGTSGTFGYDGAKLVANNNLSVSGTITASGDITYSSDIALKENIVPISGALERIKALGGYLYDRKDSGAHSAGLLAQEVEKVLPEAVHTDERGMKAIAAGPLIGLLVQAIKELAK